MTTPAVPPEGRALTGGQQAILGAAILAMIGIGCLGAGGTYANITSRFPGPTALGAVAGGEGATLILAMVYVGLTMLGQSTPAAVRIGLWLLPAIASATSAAVASGSIGSIVYAVSPMAMCVGAEGAGLLARRIVIATTGVDMETQRRNASVVRRLAYEQARAARHPSERTKKRAQRRAWRLAARVGTGDTDLGAGLVTVQRTRVTAGADAALAAMFAPAADTLALPPAVSPVTPTDTQISTPETAPEPVADTLPDTASHPAVPTVTLDQLAAVAGISTPLTGVPLSDEQLDVVLRSLRYRSDPPVSYRAARDAFREGGFVGSEKRLRIAWGLLMSNEETDSDPEDVPTP